MMQELKLKVNTGAVTIAVENESGRKIGEFEFIPTDTDIVNRYEKTVDFFNHIDFSQSKSDLEKVKEFSEQVKKQFDYLFNYQVSDGIFKQCGPLTVVQSGDFFFEHVLEGLAHIIEQTMNERIEKKIKKVQQATSKYHK